MPFCEINEDNKQRINLSKTAQATMENDMFCFREHSRSGFINRIITNFAPSADASIASSLEQKKEYWKKLFIQENVSQATSDTIVQVLSSEFLANLQDQVTSYPKGTGITFRINNENLEYLTFDDDCQENQYYTNFGLGKYLKALMEEYSRKSYLEREAIYFKDIFDSIENAIDSQNELLLTLNDGRKIHLRPYIITTDPLSMYHYIVGYALAKGCSDNSMHSFSYRISNIQKVKIFRKKAFISSEKKKQLNSELREKGAQFMCEDIYTIKIRLTEEGQQKYHRILHLRPQYTSCTDNIYTFQCTLSQIEYYFFKFGKDAEIIEPSSLKDRFCEMYEQALSIYD